MGLFLTGIARPANVPADEAAVRSTLEPVDQGEPQAEAPRPPEFNELFTDQNPHNGLPTRMVASDWTESERVAPFWAGHANPTDDYAIVNRRQDQAGTAAARELAGEGTASLPWANGIEPVIRDGGSFGADYFAVEQEGIQPTMGAEMTIPPGTDQDVTAAVAATGKRNTRRAAAAASYEAWITAVTG
ncbi:hypothetical protein Aph01nite_76760 [Acrocarpospora phusangensis]|uniref:Uncharacterized protein n=1 Tax=Acrocarpospora phusangensis TaxID=1070424 RepID=A0A919QIB8_9ACTN|nr:hypothetical protein [Acrocarpospora phusangensis]GIH29366.1 hypothetical protein Aph01nite_76760 [Acrocarpospora phusangensis]